MAASRSTFEHRPSPLSAEKPRMSEDILPIRAWLLSTGTPAATIEAIDNLSWETLGAGNANRVLDRFRSWFGSKGNGMYLEYTNLLENLAPDAVARVSTTDNLHSPNASSSGGDDVPVTPPRRKRPPRDWDAWRDAGSDDESAEMAGSASGWPAPDSTTPLKLRLSPPPPVEPNPSLSRLAIANSATARAAAREDATAAAERFSSTHSLRHRRKRHRPPPKLDLSSVAAPGTDIAWTVCASVECTKDANPDDVFHPGFCSFFCMSRAEDAQLQAAMFESTRGTVAITPRGVRGLENMGNTCYLNTGLELLFNLPFLVSPRDGLFAPSDASPRGLREQVAALARTRAEQAAAFRDAGDWERALASFTLAAALDSNREVLVRSDLELCTAMVASVGSLTTVRYVPTEATTTPETEASSEASAKPEHEHESEPEPEPGTSPERQRSPTADPRELRPVRVSLSPEMERIATVLEAGKVLMAFRKLLADVWMPDAATPLEPKAVHDALPPTRFGKWAQEDVHDLLSFLLDALETATSTADDVFELASAQENDATLDAVRDAHPSLVADATLGVLYHSWQCTTCGESRTVREPFSWLTLPIPDATDDDPDDRRRRGIWSTIVVDNVMCAGCDGPRPCERTTTIESLPTVLFVALSRFAGSCALRKKTDTVRYPLASLVLDGASDGSYMLTGVGLHRGPFGGGHYTSYVRSLADTYWYNLNDEYASLLAEPEVDVISPHAYVLVYTRADKWDAARTAVAGTVLDCHNLTTSIAGAESIRPVRPDLTTTPASPDAFTRPGTAISDAEL
ncbi:ubiquitin carboxyl-terminal hydrolase 2 [Thecamonas trahens ATCC 50062]|uniref:Ubiquitin carboxyl-terminal hydrolase 2 n=1 Tax=Thecamonas trahens ATCC 50062 TaxID=461836 RepID=A0A0L0D1Q7_THETB|nr:ubiquitin carboxyl-terminal hydrolase 2 [Thecamonas trahens ATCC 50062]KNC46136.1 ubiquitin carboxyl-terminal hydrolase 2 [Thecamonas trahens ATCC 50062]|eukprot:XP_013763113.1 ubiquitin carboxyl-terminal hydrolase 2 [Thecamonas trahens ATCC 50062]